MSGCLTMSCHDGHFGHTPKKVKKGVFLGVSAYLDVEGVSSTSTYRKGVKKGSKTSKKGVFPEKKKLLT